MAYTRIFDRLGKAYLMEVGMGDRMGDRHVWTAAPSVAERARSVLAAAWSCAVTAEGGREELLGAHTVTPDGRVLLHVPEDSALLATAICAPAASRRPSWSSRTPRPFPYAAGSAPACGW